MFPEAGSDVPVAHKCIIFPPRKKCRVGPTGHRDRANCHMALTIFALFPRTRLSGGPVPADRHTVSSSAYVKRTWATQRTGGSLLCNDGRKEATEGRPPEDAAQRAVGEQLHT